MSMAYIRDRYWVPAKRGMRVEYHGDFKERQEGVITGSREVRLRVRFYGEKKSKLFHPHNPYLIYKPRNVTKP